MNILLIAYYYPPIISGGSQRPARIAKYLAKLGNQVTVLAPTYAKTDPPEQNVIRIYDASHNMNRRGIRGWQWLFMRMPVEILNCLGRYSSIYSHWRRRVMRHADAILQRAQPEIIVVTYPPVETLEIGLHFAKKFKLPLVADFRDGLLFESVESKRLSRFACLRQKYKKVEEEIASHAAAIITISPYLSGYFKSTYDLKNVVTIPNGYDPDDRIGLSAKISFDANVLNIVHTGKIALSDAALSLRPFIAAMERVLLADQTMAQKLHLHFVGKLTAREVKALAALKKMGVVSLYGEKKRDFSLAMQRSSDLLLLITPAERPGIAPGKLFEYLAMQKPILALDSGTYAAEIIRETKSGWVVPAHDTEQIGKIIEKIIHDPDFRAVMTPSEENIQKYSATRQVKELNAILQQILSGGISSP
jgi:glycosyltransferase involved in cell wall biosynthesis